MKLSKIIENLQCNKINFEDLEIDNLMTNSKYQKPNSLFFCYQGVSVDSHDFVNEAIDNGAIALIVEKNLKRLLNSEEKQATLLISIENLNNYKSVYSEIAGDKIIQTLIAIIKSTVDTIDFLGQIDEKTLIIITNPYGAEKLAAFLTFAFDTVAPKFYSNDDVKRGYIILKGDRKAGMRINFVSILISGIIDNYKLISTPEGLLERLST